MKICAPLFSTQSVLHDRRISCSWMWYRNNIWWSSLLCNLQPPALLLILSPRPWKPSAYILPLIWQTICYIHKNKKQNYTFLYFNICISKKQMAKNILNPIFSHTFPENKLILIFFIYFWFINVVSMYFKFVTFLTYLLTLCAMLLHSAFCWVTIYIHLVCSAFTARSMFFLASNDVYTLFS